MPPVRTGSPAPGDDFELNTCAKYNAASHADRYAVAIYFAELYSALRQDLDSVTDSLDKSIPVACKAHPEDRTADVVAALAKADPKELPGP